VDPCRLPESGSATGHTSGTATADAVHFLQVLEHLNPKKAIIGSILFTPIRRAGKVTTPLQNRNRSDIPEPYRFDVEII